MDWTRAELKTRAKEFLKTRYWYALLITFLAGLLGGGSSFSFSFRNDTDSESMKKFFETLDPTVLILFTGAAAFVGLLALLFSVFVGIPVGIGMMRWFSRTREGGDPSKIGLLFSLFKQDSYLPSIGASLWMRLWLFLWSLPSIALLSFGAVVLAVPGLLMGTGVAAGAVLLIPGIACLLAGVVALFLPIVKEYAYRMTPWILADNPRIGYKRALKLSIAMTAHQKLDMFVLDLSFIGWFLLGLLACCVGVIGVPPYVNATFSELYHVMKHASIQRGESTMEEFGYALVTDAPAFTGDAQA